MGCFSWVNTELNWLFRAFALSRSFIQVVILQTAQTLANAGVCGELYACAVGGTFD